MRLLPEGESNAHEEVTEVLLPLCMTVVIPGLPLTFRRSKR